MMDHKAGSMRLEPIREAASPGLGSNQHSSRAGKLPTDQASLPSMDHVDSQDP